MVKILNDESNIMPSASEQDSTDQTSAVGEVSTAPETPDAKITSDDVLGVIDLPSQNAPTGTSGIGPVASSEQYANMLRPEDKEFNRQMSEDWGIGTPIRSALETSVPVVDELVAGIMAIDPKITYPQAMKILSAREAAYRQEYPVPSIAADLAVGIPLAVAGGAGLKAAGLGAKAIMGTAGAYAIGAGAMQPKQTMTEPGYTTEAVKSGAINLAGLAAGAIGEKLFKWGGKGLRRYLDDRMIEKIIDANPDAETKSILRNWVKDVGRYSNFGDNFKTTEARTKAYNQMVEALEDINNIYEKYGVNEKKAEEVLDGLKNSFDNTLNRIEKDVAKAAIPTSGTADEIYKHIKNLDEYKNSQYDRYWQHVPDTFAYSTNPEKYGIPTKSLIDSADEAMTKILSKADKDEGQAAVKSAVLGRLDAWKDNIISKAEKFGANKQALEFIRNHKEIIGNPEAANSAINSARTEMLRGGVTPESIKNALRYVEYLDPQEAKEYASVLFNGSTGFASLNDQAGLALGSDLGRKVNKNWYVNWADKFTNLPEMLPAKKIHDFAYDVNDKFVIPLKDRFILRKANKQATTSAFISAATDEENQIRNGFRAASLYGNFRDKNLVDLATRIAESVRLSKETQGFNLDEAISRMNESKKLGLEALEVLGKMDPMLRAQYKSLEDLASSAIDQKSAIKKIVNEAEDFYKKHEAVIKRSPSTVEGWLGSMASGRYSKLNRQQMETSVADRGIEHLQNWIAGGDQNKVNAAMDELRKLREIDILNKRTIRGSREAVQAKAMGETAVDVAGMVAGVGPVAKIARIGGNLAVMADKATRELVNGKWTNLQPLLIEKALNRRASQIEMSASNGLLSGVITRAINDQMNAYEYRIDPDSPEGAEVVQSIKNDKKLTPKEKIQAINTFNKNGINMMIPNS